MLDSLETCCFHNSLTDCIAGLSVSVGLAMQSCMSLKGSKMKTEFYKYCLSFYGKGEIYELNAPDIAIKSACDLVAWGDFEGDFEGDSFDREKVRNILEILGFWEVTR